MKHGARRKTRSSDHPPPPPPPPLHPVRNEINDQVNNQVKYGNQKQEQEQHQLPMNDGEYGGNGYDEEEEGGDQSDDVDVYGGRADGGENNGEEERPKLAEGFYEIESVRRKRIRKGETQYLIKWCGWPESANTWEPVENLMSCPEFIDAFEERSRRKRKRKRKHTVGPTPQSKKTQKQQHSPDATYHIPSVKLKIIEEPLTENNVVGTTQNRSNDTGSLTGYSTNQENMTQFSVDIHDDLTADNVTHVEDGTRVLRVSPRIGAKRRKSCAVKRFKKESNSAPKKDAIEKTTSASVVIVNGLESTNIMKIIKPVKYATCVLKDTQEVCVSFLVRRSDGEEVVVDNKYLKENNPILLINFYEQHLRYNNPSQ